MTLSNTFRSITRRTVTLFPRAGAGIDKATPGILKTLGRRVGLGGENSLLDQPSGYDIAYIQYSRGWRMETTTQMIVRIDPKLKT